MIVKNNGLCYTLNMKILFKATDTANFKVGIT